MAGMLEFAIFGLLMLLVVCAIYSAIILVLLSLYSLITRGDFSILRMNWLEVVQASLVSASLNNLSVTVIAALAITEAIGSGLGGNYLAYGFSGLAYPALLAIFTFAKIAALSAISFIFWLLIAIALSAYLIGRKSRNRLGVGGRNGMNGAAKIKGSGKKPGRGKKQSK